MKLLVVEDDLALSAGLCFELDMQGYITVAAYNSRKAMALVEAEAFDLAILDVNLPDGNGFSLCQTIKSIQPRLPVIFLTANDLEDDVLRGFDMGAEDYVTKPFNMKILLRRVEVALRRGASSEQVLSDDVCWDDGYLRLDFTRLVASKNNETLVITPNEYKLLRLFIEHPGQILTRTQLLERLWDSDGVFIDDHTLTVTVNRLRAKIEDDAHHYIKTVRGMGYVWSEEKQCAKNG
ncbi:MAG: response regulator transcription factor [Peptococcaceae bacterium]|nr:response regulator transcription factor [Peptococcaceae bacterium]